MREKTRSVALTTSVECHPAGKFSSQSGGFGYFLIFVKISSLLLPFFFFFGLSYKQNTLAGNGFSYLPPESRVYGSPTAQDTAGHLIGVGACNTGYGGTYQPLYDLKRGLGGGMLT